MVSEVMNLACLWAFTVGQACGVGSIFLWDGVDRAVMAWISHRWPLIKAA